MPNQRKQFLSNQGDPRFEDNVGMLFEELELSLMWDRPSVLLAVYKSEAVKAQAITRLRKRLARLHQKTIALVVNESNFDVPLEIIKPGRADTVFFVSDLIYGGGKNSANAYRALNIRRELLIENKARAVFWLADYEFILLPYFAPDFWAFRHRVIDFTNVSAAPVLVLQTALNWDKDMLGAEAVKKIPVFETVLANLPANAKTGPTRADLLIALAGFHWADDNPTLAVKQMHASLSIAASLDLRAEQHRALAGLGVISSTLGADVEAVRYLRQASKFFDKDPFIWNNLAKALAQLGWHKRALVATKKALALTPANAISWLNLGKAHLALGSLGEARAAFRKALGLNPHYFEAWIALGDLLEQNRKIKEAVNCYTKAARLQRQSALPWIKLSYLHFYAGEHHKALLAIKRANVLAPMDSSAWHALGSIQQALGNYQLARSAYQKALDVDGEFFIARISFAACCLAMADQGGFDQQIEFLKHPPRSATRFERVLIHALLGRVGRALQLIKAEVKKDAISIRKFEHEPILFHLRKDPRFRQLRKSSG